MCMSSGYLHVTCVSRLKKPPLQGALVRRFQGCARECGADICRDARAVSRRSLCGLAGLLPANCQPELHCGVCGHRSAGRGSAGECRSDDFRQAPPKSMPQRQFPGQTVAGTAGRASAPTPCNADSCPRAASGSAPPPPIPGQIAGGIAERLPAPAPDKRPNGRAYPCRPVPSENVLLPYIPGWHWQWGL